MPVRACVDQVSDRDFWIDQPPPPSTPPIRSGNYRHVSLVILSYTTARVGGRVARGLRAKSNFPNHFKLICPVQSSPKKYSAFAVGQISDLNPPVSPDKRGGSRSSRNARWD